MSNNDGFWTLHREHYGQPNITLCTPHALTATNMGLVLAGQKPTTDMSEAANLFEMILAMAGKHDHKGITYSETGECAHCAYDASMARNKVYPDDISPDDWKQRYMK